jgi:hypothetical protein
VVELELAVFGLIRAEKHMGDLYGNAFFDLTCIVDCSRNSIFVAYYMLHPAANGVKGLQIPSSFSF